MQAEIERETLRRREMQGANEAKRRRQEQELQEAAILRKKEKREDLLARQRVRYHNMPV